MQYNTLKHSTAQYSDLPSAPGGDFQSVLDDDMVPFEQVSLTLLLANTGYSLYPTTGYSSVSLTLLLATGYSLYPTTGYTSLLATLVSVYTLLLATRHYWLLATVYTPHYWLHKTLVQYCKPVCPPHFCGQYTTSLLSLPAATTL